MADKKNHSEGGSFFSRLFSKFLKNSDPEAEKKRLLKNIAKDASKSKYKFIKPSSQEVTPQLAKFLYDIYKTIAPAQAMVRGIQNPNALKNAVISSGMTESQRELYEQLAEENIEEMSTKISFSDLDEQIKNALQQFSNEFDSERIAALNDTYKKMEMFKTFCDFDYFFVLKKFDSSLRESTFSTPPKFETIRGNYIIDDLKDFLDIVNSMPLDGSWANVLKVFKDFRGIEPVAPKNWNKIISTLRDVKLSGILDMTIKLILQDPLYTQKVSMDEENFVDEFIDKLKNQTLTKLKNIEKQRKDSKIDELATSVFGSSNVIRLKNYTSANNDIFLRKGLDGYLYYQPLNYMKAFLTDYFKKDIREFADLVLIRGKWTTNILSKQSSDVYNALIANSEDLNNFDESISEESERGAKIKGLSLRSDRDTEATKILRTQLRDVNEEALEILTSASQNLVHFAKDVKALLEDKEKSSPQMISNWKELEHFAETPIKDMGIAIYKKIYNFVTLMQVFLKKQ